MLNIRDLLGICAAGILFGAAQPAYSQFAEQSAQPVASSMVSVDEGDDTDSALATDGAGTVVAVWLQQGGIGISRSTDSGVTWVPVLDLVQAGDTTLDADVAYSGNGIYVAMWLHSPSSGVVQVKSARSADNGRTWSEPEIVPCSNPLTRIDMASNGAGTIIASLSGLRLTSFDFGQTWSESVPVADSVFVRLFRVHAPITYTAGQFVQAYMRSEMIDGCIMPGSIDCYFWHYIAAKSADGINWTEHYIIPTPSGWDGTLLADIAASGSTIAVMGKDPVGSNEYALTFSTSQDGGVTWSAPAAAGGTTTEDGEATLAGNAGGWILAHEIADSAIQVYTSSSDTASFSLLKELGEFTDPYRSPAAISNGAGFLLSYDDFQSPESGPGPGDWDIWSAFVTGGSFVAGPIVSEAAVPEAPTDPMLDTKLSINLKFNKPDKDSIKLIGVVPIPAGFNPLGMPITVNIGGVERAFIMDGKGKASFGADRLKLKVKSKKGVVEEQLAKVRVTLKRGNFAGELADEGLVNGDVQEPVFVNVTIQYGDSTAATDMALSYKAKADKKGKAK